MTLGTYSATFAWRSNHDFVFTTFPSSTFRAVASDGFFLDTFRELDFASFRCVMKTKLRAVAECGVRSRRREDAKTREFDSSIDCLGRSRSFERIHRASFASRRRRLGNARVRRRGRAEWARVAGKPVSLALARATDDPDVRARDGEEDDRG